MLNRALGLMLWEPPWHVLLIVVWALSTVNNTLSSIVCTKDQTIQIIEITPFHRTECRWEFQSFLAIVCL